MSFEFELTATEGAARAGVLSTPHGQVKTPTFMPVGTQGSVKCLSPGQVRRSGAGIVLANAYHLMIRPGAEVVAGCGGIQDWCGWRGPMLTDSGGYQLFSLAELARVSDEGVEFRSHIDGAPIFMSPEDAIGVQKLIGADIIMPLDDCVGFPIERRRAEKSVARTLLWARRSKAAHAGGSQALFAIVQGGTYHDLRRESAEGLVELDLAGYAVGGVSVGEGTSLIREIVEATVPYLPPQRPRYLMGVGPPEDLLFAVAAGIDMFDCVMPTRNGRNGWAFTADGIVKVKNSLHARECVPLEEGCDCYTCVNFTRSYLRHLFNAGEMLGMTLVSLHNLRFFARLMEGARDAITRGAFGAYSRAALGRLGRLTD